MSGNDTNFDGREEAGILDKTTSVIIDTIPSSRDDSFCLGTHTEGGQGFTRILSSPWVVFPRVDAIHGVRGIKAWLEPIMTSCASVSLAGGGGTREREREDGRLQSREMNQTLLRVSE